MLPALQLAIRRHFMLLGSLAISDNDIAACCPPQASTRRAGLALWRRCNRYLQIRYKRWIVCCMALAHLRTDAKERGLKVHMSHER